MKKKIFRISYKIVWGRYFLKNKVLFLICLLVFLTLNASDIGSKLIQSRLFLENEEYEKCITEVDKLLQEDSKLNLAYFIKALAYLGKENYESSLNLFDKCISLKSYKGYGSFNLYKIDILSKQKKINYEEALQEIVEIKKEFPQLSYLAKSVLAKFYIDNGDIEKANLIIKIELEDYESDILMRVLRSRTFLISNNTEQFFKEWDWISKNIENFDILNPFEFNRNVKSIYESNEISNFPLFTKYLVTEISLKKSVAENFFSIDYQKLITSGMSFEKYITENFPDAFHYLLMNKMNEIDY
jgi:hypothetical protein